MASKTKANVTVAAQAQAEAGMKFTVEKLRENCRQLFGVSTSTFIGATYGMTGKYTVEEMRTHIEKWGKKGVK